jgi:hypothetical protein
VIGFRNDLLSKEYEHKYIDTQMDFVLPFFKHRLKRPIVMERGTAQGCGEPSRAVRGRGNHRDGSHGDR